MKILDKLKEHYNNNDIGSKCDKEIQTQKESFNIGDLETEVL